MCETYYNVDMTGPTLWQLVQEWRETIVNSDIHFVEPEDGGSLAYFEVGMKTVRILNDRAQGYLEGKKIVIYAADPEFFTKLLKLLDDMVESFHDEEQMLADYEYYEKEELRDFMDEGP